MKTDNPACFMVHPRESSRSLLAPEAVPLAPWFHNLHLPDGRQTAPDHPLGDFPAYKWEQIASFLPEDLSGWKVLDVGCNAGFYSIETARRGASVIAMDVDPHFLAQARWAARQWEVEANIEFRLGTVYDVARWSETFDLVLFMGLFYHLRYPLLGLDILAAKTTGRMVFQTLSLPGNEVMATPDDQSFAEREAMLLPGWPRMAFIEKSLAGDVTNWWVPNHAGIEALLRSAGLKVEARPGHEIYVAIPDPQRDHGMQELISDELAGATGLRR